MKSFNGGFLPIILPGDWTLWQKEQGWQYGKPQCNQQ